MRRYYPPEMLECDPPAWWLRWLDSHDRYMQAANFKTLTRRNYQTHLIPFGRFLTWKHCTSLAEITQEHVQDFLILSRETHSPFTVDLQFSLMRGFFNWLIDEQELEKHPMQRMKRPKLPESDKDVIREDHLVALLKECEGTDFYSRRDTAIIRLFLDTGLRLAELAAIKVTDLQMTRDYNAIRVFGKGGSFRDVPFGRKTALAIDRYLRRRGEHKDNGDPSLWLGLQGGISKRTIQYLIGQRAIKAGIPEHLHPHLFRHTFAHLWLDDGGQEGDLRAIGGWRSDVMRRYGRKLAGKRAMDAHKRHSPGDKF